MHSTQAQIKVIKNPNAFKVKNDLLDIKIINNSILVPLDIGYGLKVYFLLDTGSHSTIITDPIISQLIGLEYERDIQLKGYGEDPPIEAYVANGFSFQVPGERRSDTQRVLVLKEAIPLEQLLGEPVYGIIGYRFLKDYDVRLYFKAKQMEILQSGDRKIPKNYHKLDIEFISGKPHFTTKILHNNQVDTLKLLIDTGFSGAVNLYPQKKAILHKTDSNIKNYMGIGLNGRVISTLFKLDWIRVGSACIPNATTTLIDSLSLVSTDVDDFSDGSIGTDVLRRFNVIFDYPNQAIYLRPKSGYQKPFFYNASGIRLVQYSDTTRIIAVRPESAAELAGIKPKDILLRVDGFPVRNQSITKIYEKLNRFDKPNRSLFIRRENEDLEIDFMIDIPEGWEQ